MVVRAAIVGETPLARQFFAGRYAQVAEASFDAATSRFDDADVAFAVGALTFLGRVEDAETCFEAWRLRPGPHDPRTMAASRFFLGVAHARAGNFDRARERLVVRVREHQRESDAWSLAFVFQGLACARYFTGHYRRAARHALRALRAAHAADFAYAKLLATDLRGHALVQIGQPHAGIALLEQAQVHATRLGLGLNAFAIECSIAIYSTKVMPDEVHLTRLEHLLAHKAHDSYSRHGLLTEYAPQLALRGRGTEARRALAQADEEVLRGDARRAKLASLVAHLHVARYTEGPEACARLLDEARALLVDADVNFRAELLGFEAFVAWTKRDAERLALARTALQDLWKSHALARARAGLEQFADGEVRPRAFPEDQVTPLLRAVVVHDERVLPRLVGFGLLGTLPELFGLTPGRRILVLAAENALVLEDRGDVVLKPNPPRWCLPLLRLLAEGDVAKETLVARLWGLKSYRPARHDPLIRTAIHRLRSFLEPFGQWVRVTPSGYGATVAVLFLGGVDEETDVGDIEMPLLEEASAAASRKVPPKAPDVGPSPAAPTAVDRERICAALAGVEEASIRTLARTLAVSQSTALRALRTLVAEQRVVRTGHARATRYRLA